MFPLSSMQCYFIYSTITLSADPTKDAWNVAKLARKSVIISPGPMPYNTGMAIRPNHLDR